MKLRPYQEKAVDAAVAHFRASSEHACIVLPTGSGKSLVIAELARLAKGRVLVLAHVKELCEQNFNKFHAVLGHSSADFEKHKGVADNSSGIYSAGLGKKESHHAITFGSVQSVTRNLPTFSEKHSLLIIDECHRISGESETQYGRVIAYLKKTNPNLKVLGLTATPYRLGMGWCYRYHAKGYVRTEEARPFEVCIFEMSLREMISQKYLTPPSIEDAPIAQYDFGALNSNQGGTFSSSEVNSLLVRHKRVTRSIVEQIVLRACEQNRQGVMIFAATVDHAREIAGYLPPGDVALILGETSGDERDKMRLSFLKGKTRYLVNVSVLTTGFDAPHVDLIAILRPTESISLFQQIVGRGLRLAPGKSDCLVIDYAGNGFDIFSPEVGNKKPTTDSVPVTVRCPECEFENKFWGQVDDEGHIVEHFGRRCQNLRSNSEGKKSRCTYRFRFKECERCHGENDIAARNCQECGHAIVDPDDQLKKALSLKDAIVLRVAGLTFEKTGEKIKVIYHDEEGTQVSESFNFEHSGPRARFNQIFSRRIASGRSPLELTLCEHVVQLQAHLPRPDFVIARKQKTPPGRAPWYRVQERIFDYEGRYRKAFV